MPVYYLNPLSKRTQVLVDRKPEEQDLSLRQQESYESRLLGIIIPTGNQREYVYLGIEEGGFVFASPEKETLEFHKDKATSFTSAWERFGDLLFSNYAGSVFKRRLILKEEDNPEKFMEIVVSAVANERERMSQIKERRAEVREGLLKKLFG